MSDHDETKNVRELTKNSSVLRKRISF